MKVLMLTAVLALSATAYATSEVKKEVKATTTISPAPTADHAHADKAADHAHDSATATTKKVEEVKKK